jgi:osmoprotectant transport system permease protein
VKTHLKKIKRSFDFFGSNLFVGGIIGLYLVLLAVLLLAELGVPGLDRFRATNQVLLLLVLLFLPFLLIASSRTIRSISLKLSGQEIHVELSEFEKGIKSEVQRVERKSASQLSNAEQALWSLLAGRNQAAANRWREPRIIIGAKKDVSQIFFAHFLAEWLERHIPGLHCELRVPNGGSLKNFADVRFQWIDLYVDFVGTAIQFFNMDHHHQTNTQLVKQLNNYGEPIGVKFLAPLGATENYCLVMLRDKAEILGIENMSQLSMLAGRLTFTADPEFFNRRDCYLGMIKEYQMTFGALEVCDVTERYALLDTGTADVFVGYETDQELHTRELVVLEDDKGFFPSYEALPVISYELLQVLPEIEPVLAQLAGRLTTADLTEEVHKLSVEGSHPAIARDLARRFIERKKL